MEAVQICVEIIKKNSGKAIKYKRNIYNKPGKLEQTNTLSSMERKFLSDFRLWTDTFLVPKLSGLILTLINVVLHKV